METFTASRLTKGNKVFPVQIIIDGLGVTLKDPGLFSGKEKTIPFNRIAAVDVDSPLVGFSTIMIETMGEGKISAHGFTKSEVTEMKKLILAKL